MHAFRYERAASYDDAVTRLSGGDAMPLGGGTDLLVTIREDLARPDRLVDLRRVPGGTEIRWTDAGSVHIGASSRLAQLAADARLRAELPALTQACGAVGSPALRNMGTIGGNLCQRPRCWYFRRGFACFKNGGSSCPAAAGLNHHHAILGGGPCFIVHPSDPAVALMALDARIHVLQQDGERVVPIEEFFVLPSDRLDGETVLERGAVVTSVEIPAESRGGAQYFEKVMQRGAWDFSLAAIAAVRRTSGDVRLVLGGIAPKPWRVTDSVEEDVASGGLSDDDVATLADRALYDARPLAHNEYKVALATALLRRAIASLIQN
jgi:xanthine dehydrogenase YagS FAD-binding subunit